MINNSKTLINCIIKTIRNNSEKIFLDIKRIVAVILSIAVILPIVACGRTPEASQPSEDAPGQAEGTPGQTPRPGEDTEDQTVTRGQWVDMLTSAMGSNLRLDNDTVIFFTDVSPGDPFYNSIQTAAAYNWIDTGQDTFDPNDEVTRAFIAVSTVKALGLIGEPVSELTDVNEHRDNDYIRLAVDSGILSPEGGIFDPDGAVSLDECREILDMVRAITDLTIDPNHVDIMTLADGVVDLQYAANAITFNDPGAMSITVTEEIAALLDIGSVYILPPSAGSSDGAARKVTGIRQRGNRYVITNEVPAIEEVVSEIDIQVESYADFSRIIWGDSVSVESFDVGTQLLSAGQGGFTVEPLGFQAQPLTSTDMSVKLNLGGGSSATITINHLSYICRILYSFGAPIETTVHIDVSYTMTIDAVRKFEKSKELFSLPLILKPGISLTFKAELGIDGSVSMSISHDISAQVDFSSGSSRVGPSARIRNIESTWKDAQPELSVNLELGASLSIALDIFTITFIEGKIFLGCEAIASAFDECVDVAIYPICYLQLAVLPKFEDVLDLSHKIEVWTRRHSPGMLRWHYEQGNRVPFCTLGTQAMFALWRSLGGGVWTDDAGYRFTFSFETEGELFGKPKITVEHSAWTNTPVAFVDDMAILSDSSYRVYAFEEHDGTKFNLIFDIDISNLSDGIILIDDIPRYFNRG